MSVSIHVWERGVLISCQGGEMTVLYSVCGEGGQLIPRPTSLIPKPLPNGLGIRLGSRIVNISDSSLINE